jgi:hypothetical protein
MAVENYYLSGKAKWIHAHQLGKYGKWTHNLYLDDKSKEVWNELKATKGLMNSLKRDDDGDYLIIARAPSIRVQGRDTPLAPPKILEADGKTEFIGRVGHGSILTTKVEIYPYHPSNAPRGAKKYAMRWVSSRIDDLVPFDAKRDFTEEEQESIKGLVDQPRPF